MKTFLTLTAALVLGCTTLNAAHADTPQAQTRTVQFGDLNLGNPQGVAALFTRLRNAAKDVCSEFEGRTLLEKRLHSDCVETALSTAVTRVNRPVLSEYLVERPRKTREASIPVVSRR